MREGRADCLFERRNVTCRYPINVTFSLPLQPLSSLRTYASYGRSNVVDSLSNVSTFFRRSRLLVVTSTKDDCIKVEISFATFNDAVKSQEEYLQSLICFFSLAKVERDCKMGSVYVFPSFYSCIVQLLRKVLENLQKLLTNV